MDGRSKGSRSAIRLVATSSVAIAGLALAAPVAAASGSGTTRMVSVSSSGVVNTDDAYWPAMSSQGRLVVFASDASNLASACSHGGPQTYARNTVTGKTVCVSVSDSGVAANEFAEPGGVSADGRYVVFRSEATNLGAAAGATSNVFVRDLLAGTTTQVNFGSDGTPFDAACGIPAISEDGKVVAAYDGTTDDLVIRTLASGTTTVVANAFPRLCPIRPALSSTGRYVAFERGSAKGTVVSRLDRATGVITDLGLSRDFLPAISADGSVVSFASGRRLVAGDTNDHADIYAAVFGHGGVTFHRVSVSTSGAQGNANSVNSEISPDGRYVAFESAASTLVPGDTNHVSDDFVHDMRTGVTTRVNVGPGGRQANAGDNLGPDFVAVQTSSSGAALAAFESAATNLLAHPVPSGMHLYVHG